MNDLKEIVSALEHKILRLIQDFECVKQENITYKSKITQLFSKVSAQEQQIKNLKAQCSALQNSNAMLGSDDHRIATKTKIDALIQEINACISYLSV